MAGAIDNGYRWVLRPLLFRLPPERAQAVADFFLARRALSMVLGSGMQVRNGRLFVDLCGVTLENPVGLAAGYDKNCEMVGGLSRLGFGYLTVGTVTETPRPGNDAPRLIRLPNEQSLLNALGFPGAGLEAAAAALERSQDAAGGTLLIVSVAGTAVDEFVRCHRRLEPLVDAVELNISSPNTSGLKVFQEPEALGRLIGAINDGRKKPLLVKLPWCGVSGDEERARLAAPGPRVRRRRRRCADGRQHPAHRGRQAVHGRRRPQRAPPARRHARDGRGRSKRGWGRRGDQRVRRHLLG